MRAADIPACIIINMHLIPVIDLLDGLVVAARQGNRQTYRPLVTPLCPEPDILTVARSYLSVFPFRTFYIADLNAIENTGDNHALIARLLETQRDIHLWIDSGLRLFDNGSTRRVSHVLGSETGISVEQIAHYTNLSDCILSLDFSDEHLLGDPELLKRPSLLPQRLIIMSLARVGSHAGPDLDRVSLFADRLRGKQLYAAGGVRNAEDLSRLAARGAHGALLATALHEKTIGTRHLQERHDQHNRPGQSYTVI